MPYLPELPARGPGADLVGRAAALLVDLPVDLQPSGWRLVDRPGRDLDSAQAWLRQDLDVLAEVADGYAGPLKLQVTGPWTLAASLWLPRLERAVVDPGACRDLVGSLAEGVAAARRRRCAGWCPEPTSCSSSTSPRCPAVLAGALPTASGFGRLRAIEEPVVVDGVRAVLRRRPRGRRGRHRRALLRRPTAGRAAGPHRRRGAVAGRRRCSARAAGRRWRSRSRPASGSGPGAVPRDRRAAGRPARCVDAVWAAVADRLGLPRARPGRRGGDAGLRAGRRDARRPPGRAADPARREAGRRARRARGRPEPALSVAVGQDGHVTEAPRSSVAEQVSRAA